MTEIFAKVAAWKLTPEGKAHTAQGARIRWSVPPTQQRVPGIVIPAGQAPVRLVVAMTGERTSYTVVNHVIEMAVVGKPLGHLTRRHDSHGQGATSPAPDPGPRICSA